MPKRLISAILAALAAASSFAAAGCASGVREDGTEAVRLTEAPETEIVISDNGSSKFSVVTPETGPYGEGAMGVQLYMSIGGAKINGLKYTDDWTKPGTAEDPDAFEIVIGPTNRSFSSSLKSQLGAPKNYIVAVEGNRIGIYSESAYGIKLGVEYVISRLKKEGGNVTVSLPSFVQVAFDYPAKDMTIGGRPLKDYSIVLPDLGEKNLALAETVNAWVLDNAGFRLAVTDRNSPPSECEIHIGNTNSSETAAYYSGAGALKDGEIAVSLRGTKLVAAYCSYAQTVMQQLMLKLQPAGDLSDFEERKTDDAQALFRNDNYAAGRLPDKLLDSVNPGVLAMLSCLMYYEDKLLEGISKGQKWVYSNNSTYVPQSGSFDSMIRTPTRNGANCAMPQGWALLDMGVTKTGGHMYGNTSGGVAGMDSHGRLAGYVADWTKWDGKYTFNQLFQKGHVNDGDIFYCTGHTFIYMGDDKFFAAGHDSKWHTDSSADTEDKRKAVFDDWVVDRASCHNSTYSVNYQLRFKDEYIPHFYRNAEGKLIVNPLWSEDVSIEFKGSGPPKAARVTAGIF